MAYAQKVVDHEREEFERQHGWNIKTMDGDPSPTRDEYAPVIFSQETISYLRSLDMMSGEVYTFNHKYVYETICLHILIMLQMLLQ